MTETGFRHAFLILLVLAISALFFAMVRSFVLTVVLAALFVAVWEMFAIAFRSELAEPAPAKL